MAENHPADPSSPSRARASAARLVVGAWLLALEQMLARPARDVGGALDVRLVQERRGGHGRAGGHPQRSAHRNFAGRFARNAS